MYELPKKKQKFNAFTLIEVLVSISIMAILFTIGIANFRGTQRSKSLDAVKNQIIGDLRQAQEFANAGKKPQACSGPTADPDDYLESISLSQIGTSNSYRIYAVCHVSGEHDIQNPINVPSNFSIVFSPSTIRFYPVGGGVSGAVTITITSTTGEWGTVEVRNGGEVRQNVL